MRYKVHRLDVDSTNMQAKLEVFLTSLKGRVVSVFPNVKPTFQLMGATSKVNYLLIVEEISF